MKLISHIYDSTTRKTTVTIGNQYGIYTGYAYLNPEDTYEEIFGGTLAEARAYIKYYKIQLMKAKTALKTIQNFKKDIQDNTSKIDNIVIKKINIKEKEYINKILQIQADLDETKKYIYNKIDLRKKLLTKDKT